MAQAILLKGGGRSGSDDCSATSAHVMMADAQGLALTAIVHDGTDEPQPGTLPRSSVLASSGGDLLLLDVLNIAGGNILQSTVVKIDNNSHGTLLPSNVLASASGSGGTIPTYDGSQDVLPSESLQTLSTDKNYINGNIIVEPILTGFVHSSIPRLTSLTVTGNTVTGAPGYYPEQVSASVSSGNVLVPNLTVNSNTIGITIDANGKITASIAAKDIDSVPNITTGYVLSSDSERAKGVIHINAGSNLLLMSTLSATTLTLTAANNSRTLSAGTYLIGEYKVKVPIYTWE